jgi:hypothetical protein
MLLDLLRITPADFIYRMAQQLRLQNAKNIGSGRACAKK